MRADDAEFERDARFLRIADRRWRARIRNRDDEVGLDRAFARQLGADRLAHRIDACRSEEHTSELQSLMRISYAVFCLNKKTHSLAIYMHMCYLIRFI